MLSVCTDEKSRETQGNPVQLIHRAASLPEDLRNDSEHGPAVQRKPAVSHRIDLERPKLHLIASSSEHYRFPIGSIDFLKCRTDFPERRLGLHGLDQIGQHVLAAGSCFLELFNGAGHSERVTGLSKIRQ